VVFQQNWLGLFAWIALVPLFVALRNSSERMSIWITWLCGAVWCWLSLWWLHSLVIFSSMIPLGVAVASLVSGAYFIPAGFAIAVAWRRLPLWLGVWLISFAWVGEEYLHAFTDLAFCWNYLGHSQMGGPLAVTHLARVGGVYLVSFPIALANAMFAAGIIGVLEKLPRRTIALAMLPPLAAVIVLLLAGKSISDHSQPVHATPFRVAVIQPDISQLDKWNAQMGMPGDTPEMFQRRFQETDSRMQQLAASLMREAADEHPSLYVLPESTFLSGYFPYQTELHKQLQEMAKSLGGDIFFGADNRLEKRVYTRLRNAAHSADKETADSARYVLPKMPTKVNDKGETVPDFEHEPPMAMTVAAWQVTREHGLNPRAYNKMQLVPFGEMVPFVSEIGWIRDELEASGIAGSFDPGFESTVFHTDGIGYGAVICFESTFSGLSRALAREGARFICVLTNDAWYDPAYAIKAGGFWGSLFRLSGFNQMASVGPRQHFIQSRFRAIETGLPVVRAANSGISAVIDGNGNVIKSMPYGDSGEIVVDVPLGPEPGVQTFYVRYGDWFATICAGILALLLLAGAGRGWRWSTGLRWKTTGSNVG